MNWLRLARDGLFVTGIVLAIAFWAFYTINGGQPSDVHWYWAANPHDLYPHPELAERNGYNYTPAFEMVVGWGRLLPFEIFTAIWRAILLAGGVYLAGPLTPLVLLTVPVASEVNACNIQILLAIAVVLGFRYPATWSFVLLTKVSPGVGLVWFAVRREWRHLAIAVAATAAVAVVSLAFWADQWPGWVRLVTTGGAPAVAPFYLPLWERLPFAIGLAIVGARAGWRWTVPVAATLALPVFYWISLSMLLGALPFVREAAGRWIIARGWSLERRRSVPNPDGAQR